MYATHLKRDAIKALTRMPADIAALLVSRIERLARDPMATNSNVRALQGRDGYRLRVGDYRVLYDLDHDRRVLTVYVIGHRKEVYR